MILEEMTLEITNKCPQTCVWCSSKSEYNAKDILSVETISNILKHISEVDVLKWLKHISVSGGEPFTHPNLFEILDLINSYNKSYAIYSCGILGKPGELRSIPKEVFMKVKEGKGFEKIVFSLHALYDKYNELTQTGDFYVFEQSLKNAIECGLNIEIHYVPMSMNIDEFENICEYIHNLGIKKISILRLVPQGRATIDMECKYYDVKNLITTRSDALIEKYGLDIRRGHPLRIFDEEACGICGDAECQAAVTKVVISANGDVVPCEAFKFLLNTDEVDNIYKKNLHSIWCCGNALFTKLQIRSIIRAEYEWQQWGGTVL